LRETSDLTIKRALRRNSFAENSGLDDLNMTTQTADTEHGAIGQPDGGDWQAKLSVIVPAYNEESGIGAVLEDLLSVIPQAEIIVVDDGSSDETASRAMSYENVSVIHHSFNRGYGAAIKTGAKASTRLYIAWFDADSQHRAEDLAAMAQRLDQERLAAVIGQRENPTRTVLRTVGKGMMRMLAWALKAGSAKDLNCGLRVFKREVLMTYLEVLPDGFSASTTSTMILFSNNLPTGLHRVTLSSRIGTSKVVFADGIAALTLIVRIVMLVAPLRIFMRTGIGFILLGLIYGLAVALLEGVGFPVAGLGVVIFGLMLCFLGLIADQISQLRLALISAAAAQSLEE
jgi:glycosyltransferase involved in cell wall biosynthesis